MVRSLTLLLGAACLLAPTPAEAQSIGRSYSSGSRSTISGRRSYRVTGPSRARGARAFSGGNRTFRSGTRRTISGQRRFTTGQRRYVSGRRRYVSGQRRYVPGQRRYDNGVVLGRNRSGRTVIFRGGPRRSRAGVARTRRARDRILTSRRHLAPRHRTYKYLDPYYGPNYPQFPYGTRFYRYQNGRLVVFDGPDHTVPRTVYYDPAYAEPSPGLGERPPLAPPTRIDPPPRVVPQPPKATQTPARPKRPSLGARLSAALEARDWTTLLRIAKWTKNDPDREQTLRLALFAQFPSPTALKKAAEGLEERKDVPGAASLLRVLRGSATPASKR